MYIEIDEKILKKVTDITNFTYKSKGDFITYEDVISIIEDLVCEYNVLKEKFEDYKGNVRDNYRQITPQEMYDIDDRDFI